MTSLTSVLGAVIVIKLNSLKMFILLGLLMSCSTVYRNHGFTPTDVELSSVVVGVDSRSSVEESIGIPLTKSLVNQMEFTMFQVNGATLELLHQNQLKDKL